MERNISTDNNRKTVKTTKEKTRKITVFAMFSAISIILGFTPLGIIPIPPVSATIIHVPVIIVAILEGPLMGALMGLVFGIISFATAIMRPTVISFIAYNPLVSIAPRILIGLVAYYVYKFFPGKKESVKVGASAAFGTLMNTVGFLGMGYIIYGNKIAEALGRDPSTIGKWVLGIGVSHCWLEMLVAIVITIPIVFAGKKIRK